MKTKSNMTDDEKLNQCQICKKYFNDSETYEYRGFLFCEEHFEDGCKRVDEKRSFVMEVNEKSVSSQRKGEFVNNPEKYNINNVASDGLPIVKVNEPQIVNDYEKGIL
jgi:hypothetical protein